MQWPPILLCALVALQYLSPALRAILSFAHVCLQYVSVSFNTDVRMLLKVELGKREAGKRKEREGLTDSQMPGKKPLCFVPSSCRKTSSPPLKYITKSCSSSL